MHERGRLRDITRVRKQGRAITRIAIISLNFFTAFFFAAIGVPEYAADSGTCRSMEEEAREILRTALATDAGSSRQLVDGIRRRFAAAGFVDLELPAREPMREPVAFR